MSRQWLINSVRRDGEKHLPWIAEQMFTSFSKAVVWRGVSGSLEDGQATAQMASCRSVSGYCLLLPDLLCDATCNAC